MHADMYIHREILGPLYFTSEFSADCNNQA